MVSANDKEIILNMKYAIKYNESISEEQIELIKEMCKRYANRVNYTTFYSEGDYISKIKIESKYEKIIKSGNLNNLLDYKNISIRKALKYYV